MSAKLMGQVWDLDIPHGEAWVLMAICDHADHDGNNAYPGLDLLCHKTGYSERQIRRLIDSLESKQILMKSGGGVGRGQVQVYSVRLENAPLKKRTKWPVNESEKADKMAGNNLRKADILSSEKRTFEAQKADICDTLYKEEPSLTVRRTEMPATSDCFDDLSGKMSELESAVIEACKYECFDARSEKKLLETVATLFSAGFSPRDIREFSKTRRKTPAIQYLVADLSSWRANQPPPTPAPKVYCGSCKSGWIPPGPGEDRARRCACNRPSTAPVREVSV